MDITGLDIAQLGTCLGSIAAAAKALSETKRMTQARSETKIERDKAIMDVQLSVVRLQAEHEHTVERLNSGDARFDKMEQKLDNLTIMQGSMNNEISEMKGMLKRALGDSARRDE